MKIHAVEVKIIGLSKIVKKRNEKERNMKHRAFPVTTVTVITLLCEIQKKPLLTIRISTIYVILSRTGVFYH